MKISYYEAFDLIAEEAVDLLAEHQDDNTFLDAFSVEVTLNAVQENISQKKVVQRKIPMKIRFLIAAIVVMAVSAITIASTDIGAKLITKHNTHLVGQKGKVTASVYDKYGNLLSGSGLLEGDEDMWKTSSVIKRKPKGDYVFHSITEFTLSEIQNGFIFSNGNMVILKKEDNSGWYLRKGEILRFVSEEYPSEVNEGKGQTIHYGYIYEGDLQGDDVDYYCKEINQEYELIAENEGEYYICLFNYTSDPIAVKEGTIMVDQ